MSQEQINDHLILICGKSATGKSASLKYLENPEGVLYLNCEAGKRLPFKNKFKSITITDPKKVPSIIDAANAKDEYHTIVVDSLTYLMDMFESLYVVNSQNTMKAWGDYAQYFKNLMQQSVAKSNKRIIIIAHTSDQMNESEMTMDTLVKVKGSVMNQGVESYFSCVIAAKKVKVKHLAAYENALLQITPEDEALGYKYVFQTKLTKETVNERLRSPIDLWTTQETFIDNNAQNVLDRLHSFYED